MAEPRTDCSRYPSHPAQVRNARHHVERVLHLWGVDSALTENAVLIASELVSNAVRHAEAPQAREFGMTLRLLQSIIRIEVRDADEQRPVVSSPRGDQEAVCGRGLQIVEHLASNWGTATEVLGKTVWAEIPLWLGNCPERTALYAADTS
ncbi:ATP-binding protein [Streptomyces sp. NPDC016845]|uniref:ATP-binding protein n=1 Tax=Streptomyces sp. NPDC016845 TaxID=3364972 RepID=UPI003787EF1B